MFRVGTISELSIKTSLEKLSLSLPYRQWVDSCTRGETRHAASTLMPEARLHHAGAADTR